MLLGAQTTKLSTEMTFPMPLSVNRVVQTGAFASLKLMLLCVKLMVRLSNWQSRSSLALFPSSSFQSYSYAIHAISAVRVPRLTSLMILSHCNDYL